MRKIRLISKFMASQPDQQAIAIHIVPIPKRSKSNQAMKLAQVIDYNKRKIFSKIMQKMRQEDYFQTSFYFLSILNMK